MIPFAKLLDRADILEADIGIWLKRGAARSKRWEVRVHRGQDLRVIASGATLFEACDAVMERLPAREIA